MNVVGLKMMDNVAAEIDCFYIIVTFITVDKQATRKSHSYSTPHLSVGPLSRILLAGRKSKRCSSAHIRRASGHPARVEGDDRRGRDGTERTDGWSLDGHRHGGRGPAACRYLWVDHYDAVSRTGVIGVCLD